MKQAPITNSRFLIISFLLIACSSIVFGQQTSKNKKTSPKDQSEYYEVTETDITQIEDIDAESISVLGVNLGASIQETKQKIARKQNIFFRQDKFNNYRLYLYEYTHGSKENKALGYFKWKDKNSGLDQIILYDDFGKYMEGKSKKLVTEKALAYYEEGVGKSFLGYPVKKEKILSIPSQNLKHTAYYYKGKSYQVIKQVNGHEVKYSFGVFASDSKISQKSEAN